MLTLDHVIIRAADPAATLATLTDEVALPVLAPAERVGAITSAIARAGAIDVEVLAIGADAPPAALGYGLGFVADRPLEAALSELRAAGVPTSAPVTAEAGTGAERRRWRAAQLAGLLPDPFPIATTRRPFGLADRLAARAATAANRVPALAKAATRRAGSSMVVLTEYGFDADALRAAQPRGPEVLEVHVGTDGSAAAWKALPLSEPTVLRLHDDGGPAGVRQIVLAAGSAARADVPCGEVRFSFR